MKNQTKAIILNTIAGYASNESEQHEFRVLDSLGEAADEIAKTLPRSVELAHVEVKNPRGAGRFLFPIVVKPNPEAGISFIVKTW